MIIEQMNRASGLQSQKKWPLSLKSYLGSYFNRALPTQKPLPSHTDFLQAKPARVPSGPCCTHLGSLRSWNLFLWPWTVGWGVVIESFVRLQNHRRESEVKVGACEQVWCPWASAYSSVKCLPPKVVVKVQWGNGSTWKGYEWGSGNVVLKLPQAAANASCGTHWLCGLGKVSELLWALVFAYAEREMVTGLAESWWQLNTVHNGIAQGLTHRRQNPSELTHPHPHG